MLAKAFGTTPEYILWHVRYDRGLQYQHVLMRSNDAWTVWPCPHAPKITEEDFDFLLQ